MPNLQQRPWRPRGRSAAEFLLFLSDPEWSPECVSIASGALAMHTHSDDHRAFETNDPLDDREAIMNGLRFSIHNDSDAVRIQLAGGLGGADVETVYQAWQREAWYDALKAVIVDVTLITEADEHGRALLVLMSRFGAQIVAESRESWAIVQPLVTEPLASATSKPSWFGQLIRFFLNRPRTSAMFPVRAELISRRVGGFGRIRL